MDPSRPKVPAEAIDAYNEFIHGHLDRRRFLEQLRHIAGAGAAMGTQGPMNAPAPGGPAPGGAPDAGTTLEGMKPGRPHPMPSQVKMPSMPG